MEFIKKQAVGFYLNILVTILAIAGTIMYFGNCKTAYFSNLGMNTTVAACLIIAIVCEVIFIIGNELAGSNVILDVFPVATAVLLMVGLITFVSTRVNGIAAIMTFTNNASTMADLNNTIITIVVCACAMLIGIVSSFFNVVKENPQ